MSPSPDRRLAVVAFEPFDVGSHLAVREAITHHSRHAWTWLRAPGRAWKWRMRLGAIELVREAIGSGVLDRTPDVIFATSLLALSDLVASLPAPMRSVPTVLYMHENQVAYPPRDATPPAEHDVHFALTNLTSVLTADLVIWNSEWNRHSFAEGIADLLQHAPEGRTRRLHATGGRRECVIWPPVELPRAIDEARDAHVRSDGVRRVVWPHRWEHDKGPGDLLALARRLTEPLNLRWTILGEQYRKVPPALHEFRERFADRIDAFGFEPDREAFWRKLRRCDWVLSTARHEFFGIGVVESLFAGCLPWLPDRLSYPELLPPEAIGLSPEGPPIDEPAVRLAVQRHLEPARAPVAVARLDEALSTLVLERSSCSGG